MSTCISTCLLRWTFVGAAVIASFSPTVAAQDSPIPVDIQVSLFARILTFDRSHQGRLSDDLVIGVLYQSRVRASILTKEAFVAMSEAFEVGGRPVHIVEIDYRDPASLREAILREGVDIVYVAPLRAVDVSEITVVTRDLRTLTCTGVADYVGEGLSVGLELLRDGRPGILMNRDASRREGAAFTSELLKIARLVQEGL